MIEPTLFYNRLQFALTISFHYLFPQLTMGLAALLLYFRTRGLLAARRANRNSANRNSANKNSANGNPADGNPYDPISRFWTRIFAITFAFGVVTGITMEFQFGTNWGRLSNFAGGILGQTLAMEGFFAFSFESILLGVLLFGEQRLGRGVVWASTLALFIGTWLSGYFIITTNSFMQNPVGYEVAADGSVTLSSLGHVLTNDHILWQFLHNQNATLITASFLLAAVGAYYLLSGKHIEYGKHFLRTGLIVAPIFAILQIFPLGDGNARMVWHLQPIKLAAMEGVFHTTDHAALRFFGQPNMQTLSVDNPVQIADLTTILLYRNLTGTVQGLTAFPQSDWPTNVPLLFYSYHLMVDLGFIFAGVMVLSLYLLWRRKLFTAKWMLWAVMLTGPLPYVSTTAGWATTELGRQPWIVYRLLRTEDATSPLVSGGNALFTLVIIIFLYGSLGVLYSFLMAREISRGPAAPYPQAAGAGTGRAEASAPRPYGGNPADGNPADRNPEADEKGVA
jgi:cytochrome d ubiquinol oxidase subunit I